MSSLKALAQEIMMDTKYHTELLHGCARCDNDHPDITFTLLKYPITVDGQTFTHWAPCPETQEPILMRFVEKQ